MAPPQKGPSPGSVLCSVPAKEGTKGKTSASEAAEQAFAAAKSGQSERLSLVLKDEGCAANSRDAEGRSPLHFAAGFGHDQVLEVLLASGADATLQDKHGDIPLHFAAMQHPLCCYNLALAAPQSCLAANSRGQTPLDVAVACDHGEVMNAMLLACSAEGSEPALQAMPVLLKQGAVADTWAPNGSSALMLAASINSAAAIAVLLQNSATLELQDALGRSALMFAAGNSAKDALILLLDSGASLSLRDRRGRSALEYAPEGAEVQRVLQERLQALEATANQLQAALLASLEEEPSTGGDAAPGKVKKKKSKAKTKRSKKNGGAEAEAASEVDGSRSEVEGDAAAGQHCSSSPGPASGRPATDQMQARIDTACQATLVGAIMPDAQAVPANQAQQLSVSAAAQPEQGQSEGAEAWQVVKKGLKRAVSKGPPKVEALTAPDAAEASNHRKRCMSSASLSSTCSADTDVSMPPLLDHNRHHHPHRPQAIPLPQFIRARNARSTSSHSSGSASPSPDAHPSRPQPAQPAPAGRPSTPMASQQSAGAGAAPAASSCGHLPFSRPHPSAGAAVKAASPEAQTVGGQSLQQLSCEALAEQVAAWRGTRSPAATPPPVTQLAAVAEPAPKQGTWASKVASGVGSATQEAAADCSERPVPHSRDVAASPGVAPSAAQAGRREAQPVSGVAAKHVAALVGEVGALRGEVARLQAALQQAELKHQQELAAVLRDAAYHEMQEVAQATARERMRHLAVYMRANCSPQLPPLAESVAEDALRDPDPQPLSPFQTGSIWASDAFGSATAKRSQQVGSGPAEDFSLFGAGNPC